MPSKKTRCANRLRLEQHGTVPEGDTIFRTATTLRRWLVGRQVTAVRVGGPGIPAGRLVGATVDAVESQGKHLLIRLSSGDTLRTHMRMTGSWHVYGAGERWRKPEYQARLVLECGDRVAVCFNAPVIEVLATREESVHPALAGLGQDLLGRDPLNLAVLPARARAAAEDAPTIGELLLDQRVVAGIGNIYRCESLFVCGTDPWTAVAAVPDEVLAQLVTTAARLLRANATGTRGTPWARAFDGRPDRPWVYRRAGLPCRRCGTIIRSAPLGRQPRTVYWCPTCQPRRAGAPSGTDGHDQPPSA
jgi:endonuclease VIII